MVITKRKLTSVVWILAAIGLGRAYATEHPVKLSGLSAEVFVDIDDHGIPHIYAHSWTDAARVLGYLHAGDRLWQMDIFRRRVQAPSRKYSVNRRSNPTSSCGN